MSKDYYRCFLRVHSIIFLAFKNAHFSYFSSLDSKDLAGSQTFREFNSYIQRVSENKENIASILNSKDYTDGQKKRIIENYWKQYQGGKKIPSN